MRFGIIRRTLKPIIKIMPIFQRTAHEVQHYTWIAKPKTVITIRICSIARPAICIDSGNTRLNWVHMDVISERNCLNIILNWNVLKPILKQMTNTVSFTIEILGI